jgi:hypothetical protein
MLLVVLIRLGIVLSRLGFKKSIPNVVWATPFVLVVARCHPAYRDIGWIGEVSAARIV